MKKVGRYWEPSSQIRAGLGSGADLAALRVVVLVHHPEPLLRDVEKHQDEEEVVIWGTHPIYTAIMSGSYLSRLTVISF